MKIILKSSPNPDRNQRTGLSPQKIINVSSYKEASKSAMKYIADYSLGAGNWNGGAILNNQNKQIGRVSYNGRVWGNDNREIRRL